MYSSLRNQEKKRIQGEWNETVSNVANRSSEMIIKEEYNLATLGYQ